MNTVARAWEAAMLALTEARDLGAQGADIETIREPLQHVREMLDIIEDEIGSNRAQVTDPDTVRMAAAELRKRVEVVAATLLPLH